MVVLKTGFSFGGQKKSLFVALDWWSSYTVTIVWELAWAASALVALKEGSSYRGGRWPGFTVSDKYERLCALTIDLLNRLLFIKVNGLFMDLFGQFLNNTSIVGRL